MEDTLVGKIRSTRPRLPAPASRAAATGRKPEARKRRTQEERSTETRRRLIEAAIQVLTAEGYANLTISKVTQRAGLTNGAMQHHFPSREDLLLALMEAVYPLLDIPFGEIAARHLTLRGRVDRLLDCLWDIYRQPEYGAIWDIAFGSRNDEVLKAHFHAHHLGVFEGIVRELTTLFADIELSAHDAEQVFTLPIAYMRGCALQGLVGLNRIHAIDLTLIKDVTFERLTRISARAAALASSTS